MYGENGYACTAKNTTLLHFMSLRKAKVYDRHISQLDSECWCFNLRVVFAWLSSEMLENSYLYSSSYVRFIYSYCCWIQERLFEFAGIIYLLVLLGDGVFEMISLFSIILKFILLDIFSFIGFVFIEILGSISFSFSVVSPESQQ